MGILIFLSSCASLYGNLSKKELANAVHAKVDSREYRIDMIPEVYTGEEWFGRACSGVYSSVGGFRYFLHEL